MAHLGAFQGPKNIALKKCENEKICMHKCAKSTMCKTNVENSEMCLGLRRLWFLLWQNLKWFLKHLSTILGTLHFLGWMLGLKKPNWLYGQWDTTC